MISSICSVPTDRRTVVGLMPILRSSSLESCECVVEAGWITRLLIIGNIARREKERRLSVNFLRRRAVALNLEGED